jgi:acetyl-CoA acetyltransferase
MARRSQVTLGPPRSAEGPASTASRGRQDQWALRSHRLAAAARDAGRSDAEIVKMAERPEVRADEASTGAITAEALAAKKPAFRQGGTVTGGNSSPLNDGPALWAGAQKASQGFLGQPAGRRPRPAAPRIPSSPPSLPNSGG